MPQPQCTGPTENLVKKLFHQITQGVGGWGGSCTCPDGKVYQVGDLQGHSACSKEDGCPLACDGGKPGKLNKKRGPWSHRSVACVDVSRLNRVIEDAQDAGGWGGDCTCPDGQLYQVGDKDFQGKELACIGGKAGKMNEKNGAWSHRKVVCSECPPNTITTAPTPYPMAPTPAVIAPIASPAPTRTPAAAAPIDCDGPTENQLEVDSPYAGDWGGECTCPDGEVYLVADKDYEGKELACFGGESGHVNNYKGPWSKRRVFCAPCPQIKGDELCKAGPKTNHYLDKDAPGVGGWGGSCTCPDGQTYQVGDLWGNSANSTAKGECNALACHGGLAGECNTQQGPWSKKSVTCAPCPEGHLPAHPTSTAAAKAESSWEGAGWSSVEELSNVFRDAVASNNLSEVGLIFHGFDKPTDSAWAPYKPCTTGYCAGQSSVFWPASIINAHQRHTFAPTGLLLSPVHSRILCSWYADAGTMRDGCNSTHFINRSWNGSTPINRGRMFKEDQLESMLNISMRDDPSMPGYTGCTPC